jgi:hypothetical protein
MALAINAATREPHIMVTENTTPIEILRGVALSLREQPNTEDRNENEVYILAATVVEDIINELTRTRGHRFVNAAAFFRGGFSVGIITGLAWH